MVKRVLIQLFIISLAPVTCLLTSFDIFTRCFIMLPFGMPPSSYNISDHINRNKNPPTFLPYASLASYVTPSEGANFHPFSETLPSSQEAAPSPETSVHIEATTSSLDPESGAYSPAHSSICPLRSQGTQIPLTSFREQ